MNIAIILAGGTGTRLGADIPKQFIEVEGKPILMYSLQNFIQSDIIDAIIIVMEPEWKDYLQPFLEKKSSDKKIYYAKPGITRQLSIYNGLAVAHEYYSYDDTVIIHDGARPMISAKLISDCINECQHCDGVLPTVHVKDTLYQSLDGKTIHKLLNREELYAGQAPEAFHLGKYYDIHHQLSEKEISDIKGSSEIAFKMGLNVHLIAGEDSNFKITTKADLEIFEQIIKSR